jgi:hypothetical protein
VPAPDVAAAEADLDTARETATLARAQAGDADEQFATAIAGCNEALRHDTREA